MMKEKNIQECAPNSQTVCIPASKICIWTKSDKTFGLRWALISWNSTLPSSCNMDLAPSKSMFILCFCIANAFSLTSKKGLGVLFQNKFSRFSNHLKSIQAMSPLGSTEACCLWWVIICWFTDRCSAIPTDPFFISFLIQCTAEEAKKRNKTLLVLTAPSWNEQTKQYKTRGGSMDASNYWSDQLPIQKIKDCVLHICRTLFEIEIPKLFCIQRLTLSWVLLLENIFQVIRHSRFWCIISIVQLIFIWKACFTLPSFGLKSQTKYSNVFPSNNSVYGNLRQPPKAIMREPKECHERFIYFSTNESTAVNVVGLGDC